MPHLHVFLTGPAEINRWNFASMEMHITFSMLLIKPLLITCSTTATLLLIDLSRMRGRFHELFLAHTLWHIFDADPPLICCCGLMIFEYLGKKWDCNCRLLLEKLKRNVLRAMSQWIQRMVGVGPHYGKGRGSLAHSCTAVLLLTTCPSALF